MPDAPRPVAAGGAGTPAAAALVAAGRFAGQVVERAVEVTEVPAPTGSEGARAALVGRWWREDGWEDVAADAAGNVWATARRGEGPGILLGAHLDTVFGAATPLAVRREGGRLIGPGIGDDGIGLSALSAVASLAVDDLSTAPLYLVATVGEEGMGDLRGARHAFGVPPVPLGAFIALEGNYLGRLVTVGVGSARWRVEVTCAGGHAWERAGAPSAVHVAASLVARLASLPVSPGRTSLNVGTLHAGEAINALGRRAVFELDVRAVDPTDLEALGDRVTAILSAAAPDGVTVRAGVVGRRPAGRIADDHPLARAAASALDALGVPWERAATSTDANAAHEAGVPAIALGVTFGSGEHTTEEWIDTEAVPAGLAALAGTVVGLDRSLAAGSAAGRPEGGGTDA